MRTDVSVLSTVTTGSTITPENHIPIKKRNIKPLSTSPPRTDPITNQDKTL